MELLRYFSEEREEKVRERERGEVGWGKGYCLCVSRSKGAEW